MTHDRKMPPNGYEIFSKEIREGHAIYVFLPPESTALTPDEWRLIVRSLRDFADAFDDKATS